MEKKKEFLAELEEIKNAIINKNFNLKQIENTLFRIEESLEKATKFNAANKSNIFKSLFITFNLSNFSDITFILNPSSDKINIIEYAGDEILLNEFNVLIESDNQFFKNMDSIKIKNAKYRLYYESLNFNDTVYILLSISESDLFKQEKFHILCNIIFDIIKYTYTSNETIFRSI
jgi:hypothetical protein